MWQSPAGAAFATKKVDMIFASVNVQRKSVCISASCEHLLLQVLRLAMLKFASLIWSLSGCLASALSEHPQMQVQQIPLQLEETIFFDTEG